MRLCGLYRGFRLGGLIAVLAVTLICCILPTAAQDALAAEPNPMGEMSSAGWLERIIVQLENEAVSDVSMAPDTGMALAREWRSLSRDGSAWGALISIGWVALAAALAVGAERLGARALSRRLRQRMRTRLGGPSLG